MAKHLPVSIGNEDRHFAKEGNHRDRIEQWEDGFRTKGAPGTFEWWYNDAHLDDGSSMVIIFYSKTAFDANGPMSPMVTFEFSTPDGEKTESIHMAPVDRSSFSADCCDVRIGDCTFKGDLHTYVTHFENEGIVADVTLTGIVPPWRHGCGTKYWGEKEDKQFAWISAVPDGMIEATVTMKGSTTHYTGSGYHDHNWGNVNMMNLVHHWYWGRAKVGSYNVISACVVSTKDYDMYPVKPLMLAKDGQILVGDADAADYLTLTTLNMFEDDFTKKPTAGKLVYEYEKGVDHYRITYDRKGDILRYRLVDTLSGVKRFLAKLIRYGGTYSRYVGVVTIEKLIDGAVVESVSEPSAVWEQMYLGKALPELNGQMY